MKVSIVVSLLAIAATCAYATPKHHHAAKPTAPAAATNTTAPGYHGAGQSHALLSKNEDGTQVVLNDHSTWTVDDGDASMSSVWDSSAKIDVATDTDQYNPFKLTNEKTGETVHAQFNGYGTQTASNAQASADPQP